MYIAVSGGMCWIGLLGAALHPALAFCFVVPFLPSSNENEKGDLAGVKLQQSGEEDEDGEEEEE